MLLKCKGKVIWVAPDFFFKVSFEVSTHLKSVLLQKFTSLKGERKEGEGTWRKGQR